jgi:hypothetical protein
MQIVKHYTLARETHAWQMYKPVEMTAVPFNRSASTQHPRALQRLLLAAVSLQFLSIVHLHLADRSFLAVP